MSDLQKAKGVKGVVDIVFLIDATGSMSPCIEALKNNIQTFVEGLTAKDANNASPVKDWRAKVVGYRDCDVDAQPFIDNPFVGTAGELRAQLTGLTADGGGDEPESLLEALFKVANMPSTPKGAPPDPYAWRHKPAAARVVVIFTDATYKEPLADPKGATFDDVAHVLQNNRIILSIFAPELACYDKLRTIDKAEWNIVRGDENPQKALALFTADQANFRETLKQLAKTVTAEAIAEKLPD